MSAFKAKANNNNSASIILSPGIISQTLPKQKKGLGIGLITLRINSVERCQAWAVNNIMQFWSYHHQNLELKAFKLSYIREISLSLSWISLIRLHKWWVNHKNSSNIYSAFFINFLNYFCLSFPCKTCSHAISQSINK